MAVLLDKNMVEPSGEQKVLFPLFQKGFKAKTSEDDQQVTALIPAKNDEPSKKKRGRPKKSIEGNQGRNETLKSSAESPPEAELLDVDPNSARRKRRKSTPPKDRSKGGPDDEYRAESPSKSTHGQPSDRRTSTRSKPPSSGERSSQIDTNLPNVVSGGGETLRAGTISNPVQAPGAFLEESATCEKNVTLHSYPAITSHGPEAASQILPKKILKWNPKTGTIGSPPPKNAQPEKRSRGKKAALRERSPKSKIVVIKYGIREPSKSNIGHKINDIMNRPKKGTSVVTENKSSEASAAGTRIASDTIATSAPPSKTAAEIKSNKSPVTEWWKKPKPTAKALTVVDAVEHEVSQTLPTAEACRLREKNILINNASSSGFGQRRASLSNLQASFLPALIGGAKITKFPGAVEPAWPWAGMVHIRGLDDGVVRCADTENHSLLSRPRRDKGQSIQVFEQENIMKALSTSLNVPEVQQTIHDVNPDEFPAIPPCLRVPSRLVVTGPEIQRRIRRELVSRVDFQKDADSSDEDILGPISNRIRAHPAITRVYSSIASSTSAFDRGVCESQDWTSKYSPKSAEEVLQSGREALVLKEWLQKLTVTSVESGSGDKFAKRATSPKAKRKRKSKKLDGFVVSSDEEDNNMDEVSEPEDVSVAAAPGAFGKTLIRSGDITSRGSKQSGRLTNAVVMSGPHGCGKTASVYAVAKELGFEVFEINSGSRRSGKEILEKVGDMTRNHQVQRSHTVPETIAVQNEDEERLSNALADDLKSGRQGTMNSFFKPTVSTKAKPKPNKPVAEKKPVAPQNAISRPSQKSQKQSLILLEEVDVLYKEDKQFWETVINLIAQSKRPFIMTCNDESSLPIATLSLHAIIRFAPAPTDLAVDYMLLVAANEGHTLKREAVRVLYECRHSDLRASLTELNFWCQFAVGDVKGGWEWFHLRWPKGCDIDEQGHVERVVSHKTYQPGMGLLSQDQLDRRSHYLDIEEEMLHQAWDGWNIDVGDWQENVDLAACADKMKSSCRNRTEQLAALAAYEDFAETMSAADICSSHALAVDYQVTIDTNFPVMSEKARDDFILANPILDVSPLVSYQHLGADISFWMKSRAREHLQIDQHVENGWVVPPELDGIDETQVLDLIRRQPSASPPPVTRRDLSRAFDVISYPENTSMHNVGLEASVFDRNFSLIILDIAPYVRSIVAYDAKLQKERLKLSNLLSQGGNGRAKRMRTTRAAMSALEGGARSTTRREKYFGEELNSQFVLRTGGQSWRDAVLVMEASGESRTVSEDDFRNVESDE